jgi:putative acetyltransferase
MLPANNIVLKRTNSEDPDFQNLVKLLDQDLLDKYDELMAFYSPRNEVEYIETVIVAYANGLPAGCGCFKNIGTETVEVKRMFTLHSARGNGIGRQVLNELGRWAAEKGNTVAMLETGHKQQEAIALYKTSGYELTENYPPYIGVGTSICMKKML